MGHTRINIQSTSRAAGGWGRGGATVFFLFWMAIPTIGLVMIVRQVVRESAPWFWRQADCTVVESGVKEVGSDGDYALAVRYAYAGGALSAVEAPTLTSEQYARGYRGSSDYSEAQRLALRYAAGARATCYVNPDDPTEAVLARRFPYLALVMPLPLLFIAFGAIGLWVVWRPAGAKGAANDGPISGRAGALAGRGAGIAVVFFGIFFVVGVCVLAAMGSKVTKVFAARSWDAVPAVVVSSNVRSHRGDDSTTYSVNVLYAYTVGGREYRSNRYGFMGGSSGGYDGKRAIVKRYSPGTHFTAYVNPADPTDAVIERGWTNDMWVLLVPLAFMLAGGIGIYFSARHGRGAALSSGQSASGAASRLGAPLAGRYVPSRRSAPQAGRLTGAGVVLSPRQSPALKLVAITVICLFWNGIVSVFLYHVVTSWSAGRGEVCMSIFLIPFLAVGVGLIVGLFYTLLALFNPRCTLALDREDLRLGDAVEFRWSFAGRAERIGRLVLRVEGREEATYRQGTNTHTDKNVFYVLEVLDTSRPADVRAGKARWTVPADTMHSFSASNNKVVWVVVVHGHIAGWPDVKAEYVLNVAPLARERLGAVPAPQSPDTPGEGRGDGGGLPIADFRLPIEGERLDTARSDGGQRWT